MRLLSREKVIDIDLFLTFMNVQSPFAILQMPNLEKPIATAERLIDGFNDHVQTSAL